MKLRTSAILSAARSRFVSVLLLCACGLAAVSPVATEVQVSRAPSTLNSSGYEFQARVVAVTDGDTVVVEDAGRRRRVVRIEGLDCPESGQPYGGVARRFTRSALFDRVARIKVITTDIHKRLVARVYVDGLDVSLELLKRGLAWHYTDYSHDPSLAAAEQAARRQRNGIWSEPNPVPPWAWRRRPSVERAAGSRPDDEAGPFVGNTVSRVFHAATCKNAHCKNCSAAFGTAAAAVSAGYRPAGDCLR